jgi:hypothetical protein
MSFFGGFEIAQVISNIVGHDLGLPSLVLPIPCSAKQAAT